MEQRTIDWRDQHLARRASVLHKRFQLAVRHEAAPELRGLFNMLGRQLAARGFDAGRGMQVRWTFWTLLKQLAPRRGHRPVRRRNPPGLPSMDAELLATLMDICAWMTRLERPAWNIEPVLCVICGRSPLVPRTRKMAWLNEHVGEHQDRAAGVLIGLAAGDENGGPTEMALRLAQSLNACKRHDARDVFGRYLEWHRQGSYDTGPVAGRVFDLALEGLEAEAAVRQVDAELGGMTAGCNAAHRAGVLAMAPWLSAAQLPGAARREAGLTHHHPLAADAAVAMAVECRDRIMGRSGSLGRETRHLAREDLSNGGYSPDTLRAAAWFAQHAEDPVSALAEAKKFAGPANYCPVLVGALLGARFGARAFDDALLAHHPAAHAAEIKAAAWALAAHWRFGEIDVGDA